MSLRTHSHYEQLCEKARASHAAGRSATLIEPDDVLLARLYSHAFRGHVIGTFHATRQALAALPSSAEPQLTIAQEVLGDLIAQALDPIAHDFRALLASFYRYDLNLRRCLRALDAAQGGAKLEQIRALFVGEIEKITTSGGIVCTRDDEVPAQASFIVPGLGITIVPLVYGDQHSWNLAFLDGEARDVPRHWHRQGVEIHLGYGHVQGLTLLGNQRAEVTEGYAMAIPPRTEHGFVNTSGAAHYLPFVFGSRQLGGWGIVLDVEPQPIDTRQLELVPRTEQCLNGLVYLDREIERAAKLTAGGHWTLVEPAATHRPESGALQLSIASVPAAGLTLPTDSYRIVSVARGAGRVRIGPVEQRVSAHDHFGIPAGYAAQLSREGDAPLVVLDALLVETPGSQ